MLWLPCVADVYRLNPDGRVRSANNIVQAGPSSVASLL